MNADQLDDRFLSDGTLAALRDRWDLESFLDANGERRTVYYRFIAEQVGSFTRAGRPPDDKCLRDIVYIMLKRDRSYRIFLNDKGAGAQLVQPASWDELLLAGAGAILCQHAKDNP